MSAAFMRTGLGFVSNINVRYGYTDGTLWYKGECRLYQDPNPPRQIYAITYDQLKQQVEAWIAADPKNRDCGQTSDETTVSPAMQGMPIHTHDYWYPNYVYIGKADPNAFPSNPNIVRVFQYPALGLTGVGFGYTDPRNDAREGYTDWKFWYKGEPRLFRVAQLPADATLIANPSYGPPAASGIKYYQTVSGITYVTGTSSDVYALLDYKYLQQLVDDWEKSNHVTITSGDWFAAGFLWIGQHYWQTALGYQCLPDNLALALNDCERNLQIIMQWLPATMPLPNSPTPSGNVTVQLPSAQVQPAQQGIGNNNSLANLLALSILSKRKKTKKRKKK